jgi:hypothetical protein
MTEPTDKSILGKWRITGMELWDCDYIDMLGPGYIQIDEDGDEMAFGAVQIGLYCEYAATSVWFDFHGSDEMTEVSGEGDFQIEDDGTLSGEIRFSQGDEYSFTAKRW